MLSQTNELDFLSYPAPVRGVLLFRMVETVDGDGKSCGRLARGRTASGAGHLGSAPASFHKPSDF